MGAPKPCLGYPSRSAAIAALREQGLSDQEIADRIGIKLCNVRDLMRGNTALVRGPRHPTGTPRYREFEDRIMEMWDAGTPIPQIAAALDRPVGTIDSIVRYMAEGAADLAMSKRVVGRSSDALLAALRRHHPDRCGA
jgi:DNA-binding NarL/FixJ family response regulator